METIDLNKQQELEILLELKTVNGFIDLHNDYNVSKVHFNEESLIIQLIKSEPTFEYSPKSKPDNLKIIFGECRIVNGSLNSLINEVGDSLDNLNRSSNHSNKYYYTFSFIEGEEYHVECNSALIEFA